MMAGLFVSLACAPGSHPCAFMPTSPRPHAFRSVTNFAPVPVAFLNVTFLPVGAYLPLGWPPGPSTRRPPEGAPMARARRVACGNDVGAGPNCQCHPDLAIPSSSAPPDRPQARRRLEAARRRAVSRATQAPVTRLPPSTMWLLLSGGLACGTACRSSPPVPAPAEIFKPAPNYDFHAPDRGGGDRRIERPRRLLHDRRNRSG